MLSLGNLARRNKQNDEAERKYVSAYKVYRESGNLQGQAKCCHYLSEILVSKGHNHRMESLFLRGQTHYQSTEDMLGQANYHLCFGDILFQKNKQTNTLQRYMQSNKLYKDAGSRLGEADCAK